MDRKEIPQADFTAEIAESLVMPRLLGDHDRVRPPIGRRVLSSDTKLTGVMGCSLERMEKLSLRMRNIDDGLNYFLQLAANGEKIDEAKGDYEDRHRALDDIIRDIRIVHEQVVDLEEEYERLKTGFAAPRWPREERPQGKGECNRPSTGHCPRDVWPSVKIMTAARDGCIHCLKQYEDDDIYTCAAGYNEALTALDFAIWSHLLTNGQDQDMSDAVLWLRMNGMWPWMYHQWSQRLIYNGEAWYRWRYYSHDWRYWRKI